MSRFECKSIILVSVLVFLSATPGPAQTGGNIERTHEVENLVSLSPQAVITILQREPGLLLEFKKILVRKAYEQGRLLDSSDLNDEAVFQLLREDNAARALATREIEARMYVRPKPVPDELRANDNWRIVEQTPVAAAPAAATAQAQSANGSQEAQYWATHDRIPVTRPQVQAAVNEESDAVAQPVANPAPVPAFMPDYRRQQNQPWQSPTQTTPDFVPPGTLQPRVSPSELPSLVSASMSQPAGTGGSTYPQNAPIAAQAAVSGIPSDVLANSQLDASGGSFLLSNNGAISGFGMPPSQPTRNLVPPERERLAIHRQPDPYQDVPSLYDLYQQFAKRSPQPQRFGMEIFQNGTGNFDELPMDVPVGPDYVVGPGNGLNIDIWGSASGRLQRIVDREGLLTLPEAGSVQVSGKSLAEVQHVVQAALRSQYHAAEADVSLARLRSVRVYVVGDVVRPGAYDVSALSTPLNALYLAGGPTSRGSLRILRHYRGDQLLESLDVYDLLLHGVRKVGARLEAGDTVQVPPLGPEVTVEGMVRRPAIYELNGEVRLDEVLEMAGGVLNSGTLRHIEVERVVAHQSRTLLRLDLPEENTQEQVNRALADFGVQDGDRVRISPILPYSQKTVYLDGHVFHPGKYAYREGMRLTDLVHSYNDLLPEPYGRHAEIIRLNPPDFTPVVMAFNLTDALAGKDQNLLLKPFDTVRIFGRFDFEEPPSVTVSGEVRRPGDLLTNGKTTLRDAVYLAGGTTPDAAYSDAQLFRKAEDGKLHVVSVDLGLAMRGDAKANILLHPTDRLFIHKNLSRSDPPSVKIEGQVAQPGKYPLGENMTAAQLVLLAGGPKRGAYTASADLTRYDLAAGSSVVGEHSTIELARALGGDAAADMKLQDGDVLTVREVAGWNDLGATITLKGEVLHPGTYGIQEGERLSAVIARAGGFRADAYPHGIIFERLQVRELEQANRQQLIRQVQMDGSALTLIPESDGDSKLAKDAALNQWHAAMDNLQNSPPSGRLAIRLTREVKRWANTSADIPVRGGDVLYVPKRPNFVMVDGSVYNPTAVAYKPGKSTSWYLAQAGGPTNMANKRAIFVIRADGSVGGGSTGIFGGVERRALEPGDLVMVPEKAFSGTTKWKTTLQSAQLAYAVGIAIQVGRSF
jgi:protein involved in polysaccharide export with SLBB domain